jgi:hypothetical protein
MIRAAGGMLSDFPLTIRLTVVRNDRLRASARQRRLKSKRQRSEIKARRQCRV